MAVLVQPMLAPAFGGVLFTSDPVAGRRDTMVVAATAGGYGYEGGREGMSEFLHWRLVNQAAV